MGTLELDPLILFMDLRCTVYKAHKTGKVLRADRLEMAYDIFWFNDPNGLTRATYQDFPLWEARQVADAMNANAYGVGVYSA